MENVDFELPGGVRLAGFRSGPDQGFTPPLLLLHGLSSNAYFWRRVAARLSDAQLVAVDQRSHGRTSQAGGDHRAATLAADGAAVIEQLGGGPAVVAGHSWGATIALRLASERPDLVAGLVLIDGPVTGWPPGISWEQAQAAMQPPLPEYSSLEEAYAERRERLGAAWDVDLEEFVAHGLVESGGRWRLPLTAPVRLEILDGMFHEDYAGLWRRVRVPVLVGFARRSRLASIREAWAAEVGVTLPNVAIRWYDSDHDVPLELPGEVADDLYLTALRAGFRLVGDRIARLDGDWERPAGHDGDGDGNGTWRARDILAHLASTAAALPRMLASPAAEPAGADSGAAFDSGRWNAAMIRRRRDLPVADLKAEHETATLALDEALGQADPDAPAGTGAVAGHSIGEGMAHMLGHQRGHLAELERVLAGLT